MIIVSLTTRLQLCLYLRHTIRTAPAPQLLHTHMIELGSPYSCVGIVKIHAEVTGLLQERPQLAQSRCIAVLQVHGREGT
jgi:hypothetical protein